MSFLGIAAFLGGIWGSGKALDACFENYMPPHGCTLDYTKMSTDLAKGISQDVVMRRTINGYYNIPVDSRKEPETLAQIWAREEREEERDKKIAGKKYDPIEFRDYLSGRARGWMPMDRVWGDEGQYEFIKKLDVGKAQELLEAFCPNTLYASGWDVECFLRRHNIKH